MFRLMMTRMIVLTLCLAAVPAKALAAADDPAAPVKGAGEAAAPLAQKGVEPENIGKLDDATSKANAEALQSELNRPNGLLIQLAQELSREVIAKLTYGPEIARTQVLERHLEKGRVDQLDAARKCAEERKALRGRLDADIAEVKDLRSNDPKVLDAEIVQIVNMYKPLLLELKATEDRCQKEAAALGVKLEEVRRRRAEIERGKKWMTQTIDRAGAIPPTVASELDKDEAFEPARANPAPERKGETAAQVLESIEKL